MNGGEGDENARDEVWLPTKIPSSGPMRRAAPTPTSPAPPADLIEVNASRQWIKVRG